VVERRPAAVPKTSSRRLLLSVLGTATGLLSIAGCGEGSGVEVGAPVNVYAGAKVCREARDALPSGPVGSVRVRVVCLEPVVVGGRLDLAAAGANARRAVEDSSSVAYLEAPGSAIPVTRPILEEADLRLIATGSGADGMATVLGLLRSRDGDEAPRESVWEGR
jgi:hypothetical protein